MSCVDLRMSCVGCAPGPYRRAAPLTEVKECRSGRAVYATECVPFDALVHPVYAGPRAPISLVRRSFHVRRAATATQPSRHRQARTGCQSVESRAMVSAARIVRRPAVRFVTGEPVCCGRPSGARRWNAEVGVPPSPARFDRRGPAMEFRPFSSYRMGHRQGGEFLRWENPVPIERLFRMYCRSTHPANGSTPSNGRCPRGMSVELRVRAVSIPFRVRS